MIVPASPAWMAAGWTMLHLAWAGILIGVMAAIARRTLGSARPEARYAVALAALMLLIASPVALAIGTIGAWSVFKAVYVEKRELKCACVGGDSNVPLGFISLTENLMMVAMAVWMIIKAVLT